MSLFATPWTATSQAPLSIEFSRQESWSRLPFPSPGDLPDSGIEPGSPSLQPDALPSKPPGKPQVNGNFQKLSLCQEQVKACKAFRQKHPGNTVILIIKKVSGKEHFLSMESLLLNCSQTRCTQFCGTLEVHSHLTHIRYGSPQFFFFNFYNLFYFILFFYL